MRIKDKSLIEYFGKKNIDVETIARCGNTIYLDFRKNPNIDINEVVNIVNSFPTVTVINIVANSNESIESIIASVPGNVEIFLSSVSKKLFDNITPEIGSKISRVFFNDKDRHVETINIGEIAEKFPNTSLIDYNCRLDENVTDLRQVNYLLERTSMVSLSPKLMEAYRQYSENNPSVAPPEKVTIGSQTLYNMETMQRWNQNNSEYEFHSASELNNIRDYSRYITEGSNKTILFYASSMVDVPLDVAEKLASYGVNCKIRMQAPDNATYQDEEYSLEEYIAMAKVMNDLIGDIDENLPEEERFKQVYERITGYLEYDYPAAYPKTKEEKQYSKQVVRDCRNLRNGLLYGKTVCAGYADILKNACLLKGIECEYIQGPVDGIENRDAYLKQKKEDRNQLLYIDEQSAITRGYHAWNKVKINGDWYNCDPTWDRQEIINGRTPKYALLSDDTYRKLGRPTSEVLRHPCTKDITPAEKSAIFHGLEPCGDLIASNKVIEFESTVDEYGNPRQFPAVPKVYPWTRMIQNLKKIARESKAKTRRLIYDFRKRINPDFDKTEEMETEELQTIEDTEPMPIYEDTEKLPVIEDTEPLPTLPETEPLPTVGGNETTEKKPSWEVSAEVLNEMRAVERRQKNEITEKTQKTIDKENEIGE